MKRLFGSRNENNMHFCIPWMTLKYRHKWVKGGWHHHQWLHDVAVGSTGKHIKLLSFRSGGLSITLIKCMTFNLKGLGVDAKILMEQHKKKVFPKHSNQISVCSYVFWETERKRKKITVNCSVVSISKSVNRR